MLGMLVSRAMAAATPPEHYHGPWCSGNDVVCKANCVEAALQMSMPGPEMYSRHSFHGHLRCVDHIIALEAVGMLRETFSAAKTHAPIGRRGGASQPIAQTRLDDLLARPWAGPEQSEDVKEQQRFIDCQTYLEKHGRGCFSCSNQGGKPLVRPAVLFHPDGGHYEILRLSASLRASVDAQIMPP